MRLQILNLTGKICVNLTLSASLKACTEISSLKGKKKKQGWDDEKIAPRTVKNKKTNFLCQYLNMPVARVP